MSTRRVWYAAYGSNTEAARFDCYLRGGCPAGGARTHPGCRDTSAPVDTKALWLPGSVYFAGSSTVWGGGMAFYDPAGSGPVAARGWLITVQQLADLITQEMHGEPGSRPDLERRVLAIVRRSGEGVHRLGTGRYETLVTTRSLDGTPVVTFTADRAHPHRERTRPSPGYLTTIAAGLAQVGHGRAFTPSIL
ncbi:histone deacetylase [Nocardioides immobilis]|uniref:histone deacetylase n=1 Tax=Nocardioides immobilis TaxID=2049295 RepID=UPI0011C455D1|nr:histone deacetylase [Nocardioides immobilis]